MLNFVSIKIFVIIINFLFINSLLSQILVQNFQNDPFFGESPQAAVRSSGIGNYGFDSEEGFFNPHGSHYESDLIVGISSLMNINSGIHRTNKENKTRKYSTNIFDNSFDFFLKYKHKDYDFHLNYFTNLYFRQRGQNGLDALLLFKTYEGPMSIIGMNPEYIISNNVLQFAISRKFNTLTITGGFLTNRYIYKINLDHPYSVELKTSFLENFQLLLSLNYKYEDILRFYILGRTANSEIELIPNIKSNNSQIISSYKLLASFPGLIAYGVQYNLLEDLRLSLEMCHDWLRFNDDPDLFVRWNQELFTSELILGINYNIFENWKIGLLYSNFLEYTSGVRLEHHVAYQGAVFFPIDKLQMYKAATNYNFKSWTIQLNYQYGVSEYDINQDGILEEKSHLLRFGISKSF